MIFLVPMFIYRDAGLGMSKEAMDSWDRCGPIIREHQSKLIKNLLKTNELLKIASKGSTEGVETRR